MDHDIRCKIEIYKNLIPAKKKRLTEIEDEINSLLYEQYQINENIREMSLFILNPNEG